MISHCPEKRQLTGLVRTYAVGDVKYLVAGVVGVDVLPA